MNLSTLPFADLLAAFRAPAPVPGGGSASALAGAVGASLLAMVAGLAKPRAATAADLARLQAAGARCAALADELALLMDRDRDAYALVVSAYRLPKGTAEEQAVRAAGIQHALRAATEAPLNVMRACGDAIEEAAVVAALGNPNASSDARVGLELLGAGMRGAKLNVDVNVGSIKDAVFASSADEEARRLTREGQTGIEAARARLGG